MARQLPKPWKRVRPNGKVEWYVTVTEGGKQHQKYLAEGADIGGEELHRLLLLVLNESAMHKPGLDVGFLAVVNQYLDYVQTNQSESTYRIRSQMLVAFVKHLESLGLDTIACAKLLPYHVTQWLSKNPQWGTTIRRMAIAAIKACLRWAYNEEIIKEKFLEKLKQLKPVHRGQEVILTTEHRRLLLEHAKTQAQRDLLIALYSSGCRPGEICNLRAENVRLDLNPPIWIVRGKPTKHRPDGVRPVALTPTLAELSAKLLVKYPDGALFRSRRGNAWTPRSIGQFLRRLRKRIRAAGHNLPAKVIAYGMRHSFATDLLQGGAHDYDVAKLMGHADTQMVHHVYGKHTVAAASRALQHLNEVTDSDVRADAGDAEQNVLSFPRPAMGS